MNKHLQKTLLLVLGIVMSFVFIYIRIIRERLPREIPFNLSFWSFFALIFILLLYIYLLYKTMKLISRPIELILNPKNSNTTFTAKILIDFYPILEILLKPLATLHQYLLEKNLMKILIFHILKGFIFFIHKENYEHGDELNYIKFTIYPRIIFLMYFFLDCFVFGELYSIYYATLILLIPLLLRYSLFCAPIVLDYYYKIFDETFIIEITSEDIIRKPEDYEECHDGRRLIEGIPFYFIYPSNIKYESYTQKYLFAEKFIDHQYVPRIIALEGMQFYKYNLLYLTERKDVIMLFLSEPDAPSMTKAQGNKLINNLMEIKILQDYYEKFQTNDWSYTLLLNKSIYRLFIICWSYILIKSLHTLPNDFLTLFIPAYENTFLGIQEAKFKDLSEKLW